MRKITVIMGIYQVNDDVDLTDDQWAWVVKGKIFVGMGSGK